MSRGSVRFLSLLVCVCFTLSMLFSSTLVVDAASGYEDIYYTHTFSIPLVATDNGSLTHGGGSSNVVITTKNIANYSYHFKIPFFVKKSNYTMGGTPKDLLRVFTYISSVSVSAGNISNLGLYDDQGNLILIPNSGDSNLRFMYVSSIHKVVDGADMGISLPYILEFDWTYQDENGFTDNYFPREGITLNVNVNNFRNYITPASADEIIANTPTTTETNSEQIKESTEAIEESVTSDTGGGILATIKNFFGSFFQNVFDTLVSVFVPEDGFFSDWFNRLNTLLSDKLGMLYAPFDLLITTLTAIMNADTTDTGIPFPGIQWEDTYLVEPFTFYFSSLGDTFTDLQGYVYFATDTVLLFAFLYLLQNKIRLILEGHESG